MLVFIALLRLVFFPPPAELDVHVCNPMPHIAACPAGVAEGGEGAPAEGKDAGEGEVGDGEVGEKREVCALESEAEGEERLEWIMSGRDEV